MAKIWRVFLHEYLRHVLRKRFLVALLSLPLVFAAILGVGFLAVIFMLDFKPVGVVDTAGWLTEASSADQQESTSIFNRRVEFVFFTDEELAQAALEEETIQGYYVIGENYLRDGALRLVAKETLGENVESDFAELLRSRLLADQPEEIHQRLLSGNDYVVRSAVSDRQASSQQWFNILLPMLVGLLFILIVNMSGGYLLQAVVEEKENRTMEIVITSVSPTELMAGKILGNLSVGLTQVLIWTLVPGIIFLFLRNAVPFLQQIELHPQFIWLSLATLTLAFIFVAALMAAVGATATEAREAQQISGLFTLPMVVPFWFMSQLMMNPNGALSVILSLFPLTAPVALPLRAAFAEVPSWQIGAALGLQALCTAGSIWLAGRIFRLGMLRYGKRLRWREIFAK